MRAAVFDIRADLRRSPSTQTVSGSPHDVESVGGIGPDADGHEAEAGLHARTDMRHAAAGGNRRREGLAVQYLVFRRTARCWAAGRSGPAAAGAQGIPAAVHW